MLEAFDINLEPMHVLRPGPPEDVIEGDRGNVVNDELVSLAVVSLGEVSSCRRHPGAGYLVISQTFRTVSDQRLQNELVGTVTPQHFGIVRIGLDMYAAPALLIKGFAD